MQNTLENIEEMIRINSSLSAVNKMKLLTLLSTLKPEMEKLSKVQADQAKSIAKYIKRSTQDALRLQKDPDLSPKNSDGIADIVRSYEVSHPILVENVNYIATVLANVGI